MLTCPSCAQSNPDGFLHCGMCGARLAEPATARVERKVVSVLFCDLVGFTAQAEQMDPEDVQALLGPYHATVRTELVRHGGTVEKYIGDAVMALFGAPIAHEDDPERAVRAALEIRDHAIEKGLELRIGVTTGEAVITLDQEPDEGKGMASGDVVNTAARLQTAAPVNGVLADTTTHRATRDAIQYEPAPPVQAKGKNAPVESWVAVAPRAHVALETSHHASTRLVGRERELDLLSGVLERTISERTSQLVTLVGVPGIGKSRLVYELRRIVEAHPELISWRRGRCLAYGDGIAYWALGEMIKSHASVLETDTEERAANKLATAVDAAVSDEQDRDWITTHLRALVGLETEGDAAKDRRGEAYAAWRAYFEALADQRPLILVFEDLHWADDGLLDFIDDLVDRLSDVPLLVVGTARPELLARRPGWGGGKLNASTVGISQLSSGQTARLIENMLQSSVVPAETQQALLARAEGNPLYAEQFTELYRERGTTESMPLPETLQGIIAARIDGLARDEKSVLQDASVVGKVFWSGALGREADDLDAILSGLTRKGFLARQRRSSVTSEDEWTFAHMLLRDVAYGQIARAQRSEKHRRTAEWLEGLGRPEDHAAVIAHHWRSALELAHAAGLPVEELEGPTRRALRAAGERAFAVNAYPEAARHFQAALELWPAGDAGHPGLLYRHAEALWIAGAADAPEALATARDALEAVGQVDQAAGAELMLSRVAWHAGSNEDARVHQAAAEALVGDSTSLMAARVLAYGARVRSIAGEPEPALDMAARALTLAEAAGADELRAHALTTLGLATPYVGQAGGRELLERALAIAISIRSPEAGAIANNLAVNDFHGLRLRQAHESFEEGLRTAERFGDASGTRFLRGQLAISHHAIGNWREFTRRADGFIAECEAGSPSYMECALRVSRARVGIARGDIEYAIDDLRRAILLARQQRDPQEVMPTLGAAVLVFEDAGLPEEAAEMSDELVELAHRYPYEAIWNLSLDYLYSHTAAGHAPSLRPSLEAAPDWPWRTLALTTLDGDFVRAADIWASAGSPTWEARLRLRAAHELIEDGRMAEGQAQARLALDFHREVAATRYIELERQLLERFA